MYSGMAPSAFHPTSVCNYGGAAWIGWRYPRLTLFIRLLSLSPVANIFITTRARDSIDRRLVLNFQWEIAGALRILYEGGHFDL